MKEIFKFIFERFTDPLTLPIPVLYEYIVLMVIGEIAYILAYKKVGNMYHEGWISGGPSGSFFHWFFRGVFFIIIWAGLYGVIQLYYFFDTNRIMAYIILSALGITAVLVAIFRSVRNLRNV